MPSVVLDHRGYPSLETDSGLVVVLDSYTWNRFLLGWVDAQRLQAIVEEKYEWDEGAPDDS